MTQFHVGERYENAVEGRRILLLGLSNKDTDDWRQAAEAIHNHRSGHTNRFFKRIEEITFGNRSNSFWEGVAYADFMPGRLNIAKKSPTEAELTQAGVEVGDLIDEIRPEVLFVFSTRVWDWIEHIPNYKQRDIAPGDILSLRLSQTEVVGSCFPHPLHETFADEQCRAWARYCLTAAGNIKDRD